MSITVTIDGREVALASGSSLLAGALEAGIYIPHLCFHRDLPPATGTRPSGAVRRAGERVDHVGSADPHPGCGLCVVEVAGADGPRPACELEASPGMVVRTVTPELLARRRDRIREILAHHPHACITCAQKEGCSREPCSTNVAAEERCCPLLGRCELEKLASYVGVPADTRRYLPRGLPREEIAGLYAFEPELCIGCVRCVRACRDLKGVDVLGFVRAEGGIVVGRTVEGDTSGCRLCGACVEVCPTGALTDLDLASGDRTQRLVPCRSSCPAGMDVPRFLRAVQRGDLRHAARVALDTLVLPRTLGRVCFHPCEQGCRRTEAGGPLSVARLRRYVFETVGPDSSPWSPAPATGRRVAVVGSGPAGLAAAHFLRRQGHEVTVFESAPAPGGMLRHGIPEYRLPGEVLERDLDLIRDQGVEIVTGSSLGVELSLAALRREGFDAVLLAIGLSSARRLGIDGVGLEGVLHGVDFLRAVSEGLPETSSVTGRAVVVIGGGNVAIDSARTALRLGAASATMACLERVEEMPASREEVEAAHAEGVSLLDGWGPGELLGEQGRVRGVRLVRCSSVFDGSGRFAPVLDHGTTREVAADAVILAIGQQIGPGLGDEVPLDRGGLVRTDGDGRIGGLDGVFASGDVRVGPSSVVTAVANGRAAAEAIDRHLGGTGHIPSILEPERPGQWIGRDEAFAEKIRPLPSTLPVPERLGGFAEVEATLDGAVAHGEAVRCLQCDLRLGISGPYLPPAPWLELDAAQVAAVPAVAGVYRLLGEDRVAVKIAGTPDLAAALREELAAEAPPPFFIFDPDPMYSKRESELIQLHLAEHGRMPSGGDDDLDDLF